MTENRSFAAADSTVSQLHRGKPLHRSCAIYSNSHKTNIFRDWPPHDSCARCVRPVPTLVRFAPFVHPYIDGANHAPYAETMEFKVVELEREPVEFELEFAPGVIDYGDEATQTGPLKTKGQAEALHEHRGPKEVVADIRLRGEFAGEFEVPCARCVEPVPTALKGDFDLIFRPVGADSGPQERSISAEETEIGYYQKDSLLLEDVLREQVLLSLPARTLCKPDCKGLCPRCGQNRNTDACNCEEAVSDPRWEALAGLRSQIKS